MLLEHQGVCQGIDRSFVVALLERHPHSHNFLNADLAEIGIRDKKLYVVHRERPPALVSVAHCLMGYAIEGILAAMRAAIVDGEDEAGSVLPDASLFDSLCCAFLEKGPDDENLEMPAVVFGPTPCFNYIQDASFVKAWRNYYEQHRPKESTAPPKIKRCPAEWCDRRNWSVIRRRRVTAYSRNVSGMALVVTKAEQKWEFIYGSVRQGNYGNVEDAMRGAYQYCYSHNLLV